VLRSSNCATAPIANLLLSTRQYRTLTPSVRAVFSRWLLATDPPDHPRLRSAVARAFTPKQITGCRPLVGKVADELLSKVPESGEVDIVDPFTMRLPIELSEELLGLPPERRQFPGDDIISALASKNDGPVLDAAEIVAMIVFLLFAGHKTVTGMLGNALVAFANFPDQRALLRRLGDYT